MRENTMNAIVMLIFFIGGFLITQFSVELVCKIIGIVISCGIAAVHIALYWGNK